MRGGGDTPPPVSKFRKSRPDLAKYIRIPRGGSENAGLRDERKNSIKAGGSTVALFILYSHVLDEELSFYARLLFFFAVASSLSRRTWIPRPLV